MALVRCRNSNALSPWSGLRDIESQVNNLFRGYLSDAEWPTVAGWIPSADLRETPDAYILEVDLPGMKKEEIALAVVDNVVTIKGERKIEKKEIQEGYRRCERQYGAFSRSFEIAGGFNSDKIEATYTNGVLHLTIPKREEAKPRQIDVKVN